jgi:hypothetical protein
VWIPRRSDIARHWIEHHSPATTDGWRRSGAGSAQGLSVRK